MVGPIQSNTPSRHPCLSTRLDPNSLTSLIDTHIHLSSQTHISPTHPVDPFRLHDWTHTVQHASQTPLLVNTARPIQSNTPDRHLYPSQWSDPYKSNTPSRPLLSPWPDPYSPTRLADILTCQQGRTQIVQQALQATHFRSTSPHPSSKWTPLHIYPLVGPQIHHTPPLIHKSPN